MEQQCSAEARPPFLQAKGVALWNESPSIKYIALTRSHRHAQRGSARKRAVHLMVYDETSCFAERNKSSACFLLASCRRLPTLNCQNEQLPVNPETTVALEFSWIRRMSTTSKSKKRGPPATARDPMIGFRAAPVLRAGIVKWAENQPDRPSLQEATRRLVELGLTVNAKVRRPSDGQRLRAREMAGEAIDEMTDATATSDDQATRKKRLLKGPEEFREVRVDRSKSKA